MSWGAMICENPKAWIQTENLQKFLEVWEKLKNMQFDFL